MPWWMWAGALWVLLIAALLMREGRKKKRATKEAPAKAKKKDKVAKAKPTKAPAPAAVLASGGAGGVIPARDDRYGAQFRQGDIPLPAGQHEFRLVRAVGDKLKAERLIAQELRVIPYQTREQAAALALQHLHVA